MIKVKGMFGDIDANVKKEKENLKFLFINTPVFKAVTDPETYLLRGFKGSGKTALLQRLSMCGEICADCNLYLKFCDAGKFGIIYINADDILTRFTESTVWEFTPSQLDLEHAWMNLLKVAAYERVIKDHGGDKDNQRLNEFYNSTEFRNTRYEKIIDFALELLITALTQGKGDTRGIAESCWTIFKGPEGKFSKVESSAIKLLQSDIGMNYYVVLDGFDHIPLSDKTAAIKFVKNLTYSMMSFGYKYNFLRERMRSIPKVQLKIFLPEDFAITAEIRDNVKYIAKSELLKWEITDLKKFIALRVYAVLKKYKKTLKLNFNEQNIDHIWKIFFGDNLENLHYCIKPKDAKNKDAYLVEDTFKYIIRHTLYRARDLQIICEQIVKAADMRHNFKNERAFVDTLPLDAEFIRTGVNMGSRELVIRLFEEFSLVDLAGIINQFQTSTNILRYDDVRDKVEKYKGTEIKILSLDEKIQLLYDVGFLGKFFRGDHKILNDTGHYGKCKKVIDSYPLEYYMSAFSFSGNFKETISQKDELVVAPMFNDYLNMAMTVNDKYLIEPVYQ